MSNIATTPGWRLVHDGVNVIALFESSGTTETIHTIYEASSKADCENEIARLNLTPLVEIDGGASVPVTLLDAPL